MSAVGTDYAPLPLASFFDAGVQLLGDAPEPPLGAQLFHGLPFELGEDPARCFVGFGEGLRLEPLELPLPEAARSVVVAHRLIDSAILEGGPVGETVADYVFRRAGGGAESVPVRDRFEIAVVPTEWGQLPFRARPDQKPASLGPDRPPSAPAGYRQVQAKRPGPAGYYLFAWLNPDPADPLASLTIVPRGPRFVVAGITIGHADEEPFARSAARPVRIVLEDGEDAAKPFDLAVEVDRGAATLAYPLPARPTEEFLADPFAGFGDEPNRGSSPAYAYVTAVPSATLTVTQGGDPLGQARWSELEENGVAERERVRLEIVEPGRNWVRTRIVDEATGEPVACRIHFRSPDGIPYQPHGHHGQVRTDLSTWHVDIGGDLRLGHAVYAYVGGTCEGWLPRGEVIVDVARGFEYEPLRRRITIEPGQQELTLRLRRWCDMRAQRWFSGDSHVHFLSTQGSHAEAQGEDLAVVNLLLSQWGHLFTNTEEFVGRPSVSPDGQTIVYASQENRQHLLGHLTLLGLKEAVSPWCSDGPDEAELGGALEATLSDWADRCHRQGGTVILPHMPVPNGEPAALIATGRVDAVEFLVQSRYFHQEYYRYLNCGYRLPLVGGTDKMSSDVPVGLYRTYVHIPADEDFSYESWCRNLAAGRTFLSGGPIVSLAVEGHTAGDTVQLPPTGAFVEVEASAESIFPISTLELVQQGRVVASTERSQPARRLELRERIRIDGNSWLAARVGGPGYFDGDPHRDAWGRQVMAHTSPVYIACGSEWQLFEPATAQYMLTLIDGTLAHIREQTLQHPVGTVTHHHGEDDHIAYLERPFLEAQAAIHRRLHQLDIPH